jgi:hypothetical protein
MANSILAPATPGVYDDIINGTCELPQTYGTVISGELEEPEDRELIRGCNGNVSAVLLRDDEIIYNFTVLFADGTTLPARGANVVFPLDAGAGPISGQVMSRKWVWSNGGQKMCSIKASHFKALGSAPTVDTIA